MEDGEGEKPSKYEEMKAKAVDVLKPQIDKLAEKQAAEQEAAATAKSDAIEEESAAESATSELVDKTTADVSNATTTEKSDDNKIQDLVTDLLSTLDRANLSGDELKTALNAFNAAVALKQTN